jgi:hypothetical protein
MVFAFRAILVVIVACIAECATDKPIAELTGTIDDCCWRASCRPRLHTPFTYRPASPCISRIIPLVSCALRVWSLLRAWHALSNDVHQASDVNVNYISPLLDALRVRSL